MKRIWIVISILLLAVSLVGCSTDSLGDYKKAVEKTEQIIKGQSSGEFSLMMDFNTEGMTVEQIKELNYFKDMKGSFNIAYDEDSEKGIFRNYLNFGGLGFDFDLFIDGDKMFMRLPVVGKHMRIGEMATSINLEQKETDELELISKETQEGLSTLWLGLLNEEDVFKGKNIILTTPDGEVKTTEYTIKLSDEQINNLGLDSINIFSKDEKLRKSYDDYIKRNVETLKNKSLEELLFNLKEGIQDYRAESFSYTAYVDIDGYIINEIVQFTMKVKNPEKDHLDGMSYNLNIKNWDINKEQKFEFPVLTDENTLDMDDIDESMPFMMEDLFNNKN